MLKTFLSGRQQLPERTSLEDYHKEIDEASAEAGNYITQEELEKHAVKW